jgi:hypothetical protein
MAWYWTGGSFPFFCFFFSVYAFFSFFSFSGSAGLLAISTAFNDLRRVLLPEWYRHQCTGSQEVWGRRQS